MGFGTGTPIARSRTITVANTPIKVEFSRTQTESTTFDPTLRTWFINVKRFGSRTKHLSIINTTASDDSLYVSFDNGRNYIALPPGGTYAGPVAGLYYFHVKTNTGVATTFQFVAIME